MQHTNSAKIGKKKVLVVGVVQLWEGHSNVKHKINLFSDSDLYDSKFEIINIRIKINYRSTFTRLKSTVSLIAKLSLASLVCLAKILVYRSYKNIYLPYPGLALIYFISLLPKRAVSAYIVLDLFISIYDTVVIDRKLLAETGLLARLLYRIERRSILRANVCITDTEENASFYAELFNVPIYVFKVIPLSINEDCFQPTIINKINSSNSQTLRVLFAGTMVPLQGVPYICETIRSLSDHKAFTFVIIGDGQDSTYLEKLSHDLNHDSSPIGFVWRRDWMNSLELSKEIQLADVCLGIFGSSDKANRVWPFKNYIYMACRKPLVTRISSCSTKFLTFEPKPAFCAIDGSTEDGLSTCLLDFLDNRHLIDKYSENARCFYQANLSGKVISRALFSLLKE